MKLGKMGGEKAIHLVLSNFRQRRLITIINAVMKVDTLWCSLDEEGIEEGKHCLLHIISIVLVTVVETIMITLTIL